MILNRIDEARELHRKYGASLQKDKKVSRLIREYSGKIEKTLENFHLTRITKACTECARENQGSCCFEGMEDNYDSILLFMNLLLGTTLPDKREIDGHCFFVGHNGCKLIARYYFCVNYFCPSLEKVLGRRKMTHLLKVIGEEIFAGWELERAIRSWLLKARNNSCPVS